MSRLKARERARREVFTIMIVPHSGRKSTFSISIPIIALKIVGGILAAIFIAVALGTTFFSMSYKNLKAHAEELTYKTLENEYLHRQLDLFVKKTKDLEDKVKNIEKLDMDLRDLLQEDPELKDKLDPPYISDDDSALGVGDSQMARIASRLRSQGAFTHRGSVDREQALLELSKLEEQIPDREESLKELKDAVIARSERLACTPSIWPVRGTITSSFGYRRSPFGSRREFHDGLDIAAPYGTKIAATADGVVTFTGYVAGYGYTVRINHGYGFETSYCHNSKILVKPGQQVKRGQAIAHVGNSGRSTGPHLHYMVKQNGVLKNPREFID